MGNLEINTSMKTLDFEARTAVAKECIHRLCGISGTRADRKSDPRINQMIGIRKYIFYKIVFSFFK